MRTYFYCGKEHGRNPKHYSSITLSKSTNEYIPKLKVDVVLRENVSNWFPGSLVWKEMDKVLTALIRETGRFGWIIQDW